MQQNSALPAMEIMDLRLLDAAAVEPDVGAPAGLLERLKAFAARHVWYEVFVVLPTAVAAAYFLVFAASRYESEARFTVRTPSMGAATQIAGMVQGSSVIRSADDAYIVHAYLRSRDAVRKLQTTLDLRGMLAAPWMDVLWSYPGLFAHSEERLWRHFNAFIDIDFDNSTGISTLKVQGFQPGQAKALADALLADSEALINRLSERAQGDAVRLATDEVERARAHSRASLQALTSFRRRNAMIDPNLTSKAALELMTRLSLEVAQTNAQLAEVQKASPDNPQVVSLKNRVEALGAQIEHERHALAGTDTSLAPLIAEYDRLTLEREFAERTFLSTQSALDVARLDSSRQRLFLERISTPSAPDYAKYPSRLLDCLATFLFFAMLYSIGRRVAADIRAHAGF